VTATFITTYARVLTYCLRRRKVQLMDTNDRCELDNCNRKQSRTGWRVMVRDENGYPIRAARVCGRHAAIDRHNREEEARRR
jgi:hypothetical protein